MTNPTYTPRPAFYWKALLPILLIKLILHLIANPRYGFHRDELLYMALGQHPDFGYWSVPPFIGILSWLTQHSLGVSVMAFRLLPTLTGIGLMLLVALIAREFGGGRWAQFMAALGVFVAPVYMRTSMLFQPVIFDIFFWTLAFYWIVRYLKEEKNQYLYLFFISLGFGLLNKYLIGFLLIAVILALLVSPLRGLFLKRKSWIGLALMTAIVLPNIWWQVRYDFPFLTHMRLLRTYQLENVSSIQFLIDQGIITLAAVFLWVPGLYWIIRKAPLYRLLAWVFLFTMAFMLVLQAKSYYSMGLFPVFIAAGAVHLETLWSKKAWQRWALPSLQLLLVLPLIPFGITLLSPQKMINYGKWASENLGLSSLRTWEDGEVYDLPQDYADMFGWEEMGDLIAEAWKKAEDPDYTLLYCDNYGQAGAAMRYAVPQGVVEPISFNGTYAIWAPAKTEAKALIYVNDELGEDIQNLFEDIQLIGQVEHPFAREKGTQVYLCQNPRTSFADFWSQRVRAVKARLGISVPE